MLSPDSHLPVLAVVVALLNVPFGYWRAGTRKFTLPWFVAVHAPVPIVIALRLSAGVAWRFGAFGVLAGAFFTGQYVGGALRRIVEVQRRR
jgi:hypothetical protein